jgi:hypothetical protein
MHPRKIHPDAVLCMLAPVSSARKHSLEDKSLTSYGAAKESNLPTRGLHGPAGFEVRGFARR